MQSLLLFANQRATWIAPCGRLIPARLSREGALAVLSTETFVRSMHTKAMTQARSDSPPSKASIALRTTTLGGDDRWPVECLPEEPAAVFCGASPTPPPKNLIHTQHQPPRTSGRPRLRKSISFTLNRLPMSSSDSFCRLTPTTHLSGLSPAEQRYRSDRFPTKRGEPPAAGHRVSLVPPCPTCATAASETSGHCALGTPSEIRACLFC